MKITRCCLHLKCILKCHEISNLIRYFFDSEYNFTNILFKTRKWKSKVAVLRLLLPETRANHNEEALSCRHYLCHQSACSPHLTWLTWPLVAFVFHPEVVSRPCYFEWPTFPRCNFLAIVQYTVLIIPFVWSSQADLWSVWFSAHFQTVIKGCEGAGILSLEAY